MSSIDTNTGPSGNMAEGRGKLISPIEWARDHVDKLESERSKREELANFFDFQILGIDQEDRRTPNLYRRVVGAHSKAANPHVLFRGDGWGWMTMEIFRHRGNVLDGWDMRGYLGGDMAMPVSEIECANTLIGSQITRVDGSIMDADAAIALLDQALRDIPEHPDHYIIGQLVSEPITVDW